MFMPKIFQRLQYDRRLRRAIDTKQRLDDLKASRAGISADYWPDVAHELDAEIDRLERRLRDYLTKLPKERP